MNISIENLIIYGINELENGNIENAKIKTKILLAFLMNKNTEYLIFNKNEIVGNKIVKQYKKEIHKMKYGKPLQYITHTQQFMGLSFYVNKHVLIPRFDTEILVDEIINQNIEKENLAILDMCTGSGAIAISLSKKLKNSSIYAADIRLKALKVAKKNNKTNNTKVEFIRSNMFSNILEKKFDIIVSNPPYIKTKIINKLNKDVKKEPKIALNGGKDGLKYYKILANNAYKHIKPNGMLALEIGFDQKEEIIKILESTNQYKNIICKKDFAGNDRIILCNI